MKVFFLLSWFCFHHLFAAHLNTSSSVSSSAKNNVVASNENFEFRSEFIDVVKEAINKDFASIVSIDEPSFKLDDLEASIRKTFFSFSSKVREGNMPWGNVIRFECRSRGIFGPAAIPINEIIPLAFSRILKAEGADVGKFMPSGRNVDKRRLEVSRIFSKILKRGVGITDDRKLTSVLWLILRYHELFPDRLKVLGDEVGAEEIQKQGKRKTPDTLNVEKDVKRRKTTSSTTITTTDSLLPSQNANNNNVTSTFDSSMASIITTSSSV